MQALTLIQPQLKKMMDQGKCKDLVKLIHDWDTDKRLEGMIKSADRNTIRLANSSLFMENLVPFMELMDLPHPYYKNKQEMATALLQETGVGLIDTVSKARKTDMMTLISGVFVTTPATAVAPTPKAENMFLTGDEDVDDPRIPDSALSADQLDMRRNAKEMLDKQLNLRYEKVKAWMMCFFQPLSPAILDMIRQKDERLFTMKEFWSLIPYVSEKKFTKGVTDAIRLKAMDELDILYTKDVEEAWFNFEWRDEVAQKKALKDETAYVSLKDTFWTYINNLVLICQMEFQIDDATLNHLHLFFVDLWQEFTDGKIEHFREIAVRMMMEVNKAMPHLQGTASINGACKFFFDCLFHNRSLIEKGAQEFQQGLDRYIVDFIKSLFDFDLSKFDMQGFLQSKLSTAMDVRDKNINDPSAGFVTPELLEHYKKQVEDKLQIGVSTESPQLTITDTVENVELTSRAGLTHTVPDIEGADKVKTVKAKTLRNRKKK